MNAPANNTLRKYQHPALLGLTERALTAVFNAGSIRLLKAQDALFHAGEAAVSDFLVLEGGAMLVRPQQGPDNGLPVFAGDCLPASMLQLDGSYTWDCQATQPLTMLQLDIGALLQLEDSVQLTLHRNLMPAFSRLFHQLGRLAAQRQSAAADSAGIAAWLTERQAPYAGTTPLQAMLANLPKLPPYTTKLTALMNDPKASTRHIVEIARQDPSLTASVLKSVNSSYFGLTHKIKDFQHAVMMLGLNQMQQLLLATGIQSTMPNTPEFRQLQAHSMMVSALCGEISLTLKVGSAPLLNTLGILHDIGKSVVLLLKRQQPKQEFLHSLLDADMVGMQLLREWQIPEHITDAVQYQSWPQLLPPDQIPAAHRENVGILHLAHLCLDRLRSLQSEAPVPCPARHWLAKLGSRDQSLDDFLLGRLIPAITARASALPLVLQDLIRKAQQQESGAQPKLTSTPP